MWTYVTDWYTYKSNNCNRFSDNRPQIYVSCNEEEHKEGN